MDNLIISQTQEITRLFENLPDDAQELLRQYILSQDFNIMKMTDSYKATHSKMYPSGTTEIYSYLEARGGKIPKAVFFGLQYYIKKYLTGVQVTQQKLEEAAKFWDAHVGPGKFDREGWQIIIDECDGKLPLEIKAVPEGTVVPIKNIMMSIRNTHPRAYFLTNWVETLLMKLWATITIASNSRRLKQLLINYAYDTCDNIDHVNFQMHDFGYRGVSSEETAALLGAAHMVMFLGTDTVAGLDMLKKYYNEPMAGFSVTASEHSVVCSYKINDLDDGEIDMVSNVLTNNPNGIISMVSDTYNIYYACDYIYGQLFRDKILMRDGKFVIRPDSGDPVLVLCGNPDADPSSEYYELEKEGIINILARRFGYDLNNRGYKVINQKIGILQGDGIDYEMTLKILERMKEMGYASSNMVFGSGGGLLQKFNRDTMKFAIKASHAIVNGQHRDLKKNPFTDPGKVSKTGYMKLVSTFKHGNHTYETVEMTQENLDWANDILRSVLLNGDLLVDDDFSTVRDLAKI